MTARERKLGIGVGAAAAVALLYLGVGEYKKVKRGFEQQIENKQNDIAKIKNDKKLALAAGDRWRDYGAQSLSMDASEVQTRLRNELNHLADQCGLKETRVSVSRTANVGKPARNQKEFVRVLGAGIDAQGTAEQLVRFLYRLHARPYQVRIKTMSFMRPSSSKAEKGTLQFKATLETPILPAIKLIPRVIPAKLNILEAEEKPRTQLASFAGYLKHIVKRKVFQPYENVIVKAINPRPGMGAAINAGDPVDLAWAGGNGSISYKVYFAENTPDLKEMVADLPKSQTSLRRENLKVNNTYYWRVDTVHENWEGDEVTSKGDVWNFRVQPKPVPTTQIVGPPPVVPPPPPPDAQFTVARILSSPMGQYVVLEDRRQPQNPPERRVEIGQQIYDGMLVYLHARGVVSEKDNQLRIHPLGEPLEQGMKPLPDPRNQYGDIHKEVMKLREKYAGITERPAVAPNPGG